MSIIDAQDSKVDAWGIDVAALMVSLTRGPKSLTHRAPGSASMGVRRGTSRAKIPCPTLQQSFLNTAF
jgi:hypothetical protein